MKRKSADRLISALVAAALFLAACGSTGGEQKPAPEAGLQAEEISEEASEETAEQASEEEEQTAQAPVPDSEENREEGQETTEEPPMQTAVMTLSAQEEASLLKEEWQGQAVFPDWKGYTDDTLAMNSMYSFLGYHGQGMLYIKADRAVESFRLYVNERPVSIEGFPGGSMFAVDISDLTKDGTNTIQVSGILPADLEKAVEVYIPYPQVIEGSIEEAGISSQALSLISDLIETDIENGFTSAQLAIVKDGRLVYENAWGLTNSYMPDGSPIEDSAPVTTETLYDLASVTKMFTVNYSLQKLLTDGQVDLDDKITEYLGREFVTETILVPRENEDGDLIPQDQLPDLETVKAWKAELTIRDLLRHQGGMPGDPKYPCPRLYRENTPEEDFRDNPLFAGNGADQETREATLAMINRTPLEYEPGTKTLYSDADYMILGLVVEKITGKDLDTYIKETFCRPMGLTHITYNPLQNGFTKDDCAATELNGNTRDHLLHFEGYREYTLQGEVHDEKAWYSMAGISGHAGLFANAGDLARLASVMLTGGYGNHRFFSANVMDIFTAPKKEDAGNWGLGWWRQGEGQRVWYFGTQAGSDTFGHQGWTGTLVTIDPDRNMVVVYLTNKINSRVTDVEADANRFDGNWYTASTLGFVDQILSMGMGEDTDLSDQLLDLTADMALGSIKLLPDGVVLDSDHPAARNARSKYELYKKEAAAFGREDNKERVRSLQALLDRAFGQE